MKNLFEAIGFYFFYSIAWINSLLPLRIQYLYSDVAYIIIYYIARYRRKVVRINLEKSFPEKSKKEIISIEKKFYRHLCDYFIESVAQINMSNRELMERLTFKNANDIIHYAKEGKSALLVGAHYGNWEWVSGFNLSLQSAFASIAIYKRLHNRYFDRFFIRLREHTGVLLVPMEDTLRKILYFREKKIPTLTYLLADQRPMRKNIRYWTMFLNQETPVYLGIEKIAVKTGFPVFFVKINKISRGRYEGEFILLSEHPEQTAKYEITEKHVRLLEQIIRERPELWLWSHRRWKHVRLPSEKLGGPEAN